MAVRLKRPWRDGTTHVAFTPEEFIEKLVALVPRPRAHQVRYHGVFAPAAADRARIIPGRAGHKARRGCGKRDAEGDGGEDHVAEPQSRDDAAAMSWAELMRRVFAHEVLVCPRCAGPMKVLGPVQERGAIEKILAYKGLSAEVPKDKDARRLTLVDRTYFIGRFLTRVDLVLELPVRFKVEGCHQADGAIP